MWEPRRLTTLCASTACYKDSFTLPLLVVAVVLHISAKRFPNISFIIFLPGVFPIHVPRTWLKEEFKCLNGRFFNGGMKWKCGASSYNRWVLFVCSKGWMSSLLTWQRRAWKVAITDPEDRWIWKCWSRKADALRTDVPTLWHFDHCFGWRRIANFRLLSFLWK
jgi:hypothetical protein